MKEEDRMLRAINNVDDMSKSIEEMNDRLDKLMILMKWSIRY